MEYRSTWHPLHLILTLCFLPWAIVWVLCYLNNRSHNTQVDMFYALKERK